MQYSPPSDLYLPYTDIIIIFQLFLAKHYRCQNLYATDMFQIKSRYLYIVLLSLYSFFNILLIEGDRLFVFETNWFYLLPVIFVNVILVWEANRFMSLHIENFGKRISSKIHTLILLFVVSLLLVCLISLFTTFLSLEILRQPLSNFMINLKLSIGFTFRINLFLHSVNAIVFFINRYNESKLEAEKLQKKTVEAQFEALRNQINPHFLFNSFNVLSELVYQDPDTSAKFIQQLSKVYRYLLYYQAKKVVSLMEEFEFLKAYIFLLNIRFKKNLCIKNSITDHLDNWYLPPATLQLLIENAIKHNIVSQKHPLKINIYQDEHDNIVVENNLQEKKQKEPSTSVGLQNIAQRYKFISDREIEITKTAEQFIVRTPLIKLATE